MPHPFVVHPPLTTLVRLTGVGDFSLADDLARNELGLPPKFEINLGAAPTAESLARAVAKPVVTALKGACKNFCV